MGFYPGLHVNLFRMVRCIKKKSRSKGFSLCFNSKPWLASAFKAGVLKNGKHFFCISFHNTEFPLPNRDTLWTFCERDNESLWRQHQTFYFILSSGNVGLRQTHVTARMQVMPPIDLPIILGPGMTWWGELCCKSSKKTSLILELPQFSHL